MFLLPQFNTLSSHCGTSEKSLANILNLELNQISVKAKSMEWMGPIGEGKCLAVDAIVLLEKVSL